MVNVTAGAVATTVPNLVLFVVTIFTAYSVIRVLNERVHPSTILLCNMGWGIFLGFVFLLFDSPLSAGLAFTYASVCPLYVFSLMARDILTARFSVFNDTTVNE